VLNVQSSTLRIAFNYYYFFEFCFTGILFWSYCILGWVAKTEPFPIRAFFSESK